MKGEGRNKLERRQLRKMSALGLPDFETIEQITARQKKTINLLTGNHTDAKLIRSLAKCEASGCEQEKCNAACWYASRKLRLDLIPGAAKAFFEVGTPVYTVTAIHPSYRGAVGQLGSVRLEGYRQWIGRRLRDLSRTGTRLVAFGSIEVTLNTELDGSSHWSPHAQLVAAGLTPTELKTALDPGKDTPSSETRVMIKPAFCLGRALAYTLKRKPEQRIAYEAENGRQHRRKIRLPTQESHEHEAWLATQAIDDRLFLFGLRRHGQHLLPIENDEEG